MRGGVVIVVTTMLACGSVCAAELPTDVRRTICSAFRTPARGKEIVSHFRGPLTVVATLKDSASEATSWQHRQRVDGKKPVVEV